MAYFETLKLKTFNKMSYPQKENENYMTKEVLRECYMDNERGVKCDK